MSYAIAGSGVSTPGGEEGGLALLERFGRESEEGFLALGAMVGEVAAKARSLVECSAEMAGEGGAERFARAVAGYEEFTEALAGTRRMSEEQSGALGRIVAVARGLRRPAHEFARANRIFRLLGLYTRVEASRLKGEGGEFSGLSDQIAVLAETIDAGAADLEERARASAEAVAAGGREAERVRQHQAKESTEAAAMARAEMAELRRQQEESLEVSRNVARGCAELRTAISRLVTDLQYQDIARQRVEHIAEELRRGERESGTGRELQRAQLEGAHAELASALGRIEESLKGPVRLLAAIGEDVSRLEAGHGTAGREAALMEEARAVAEDEGRLRGVVSSVAPALESMARAAGRIDQAGYEIGLIALNCAVKTAHLGVEGASLGVVAGELGALSGSTGRQAAEVGERLAEMTEIGRTFERLLGGGSGAGLSEQVKAQLEEVRSAEAEYRLRLGRVLEHSTALSRELRAAPEHLAALGRMVGRLADVAGALGGREAGVRGEEGGGGQVAMDRYTMQSEREIHREYLTQARRVEPGGSGAESRNANYEGNISETKDCDIELF